VLLARLDGGIIGIEVTRLHPGGGEEARRREEAQDKILKRAQELYRAEGAPYVEVVVFWNEWADVSHIRQTEQAALIANFVREHLPAFGECSAFEAGSADVPRLPPGIDHIEIRRFEEDVSLWQAPRGRFLPSIQAAHIWERLHAKDPKPGGYSQRYDEKWLVLVSGGEGRATWGAIPPMLTSEQFSSSFDRVFLLALPNQAIELRLSRVV
jgi:hypothetical protein